MGGNAPWEEPIAAFKVVQSRRAATELWSELEDVVPMMDHALFLARKGLPRRGSDPIQRVRWWRRPFPHAESEE